jgi:ABC-type branched-subunit amino acid transport system ATPase component
VLRVDDLTVTYRTGARAVDGVSLRVEEHQIVAILGRNGAGKTSTLRSISGFLKTEGVRLGGRVRMGDVDLLGRSPAQASKLAVLVPERDKIFPDLTVAEHLRVVRGSITDPTLESDPTFSRLWERSNLPAGLLSGGERQLLALAAAWQLKPALMMVDEFTLGLSPVMIRRVSDVIRRLRDEQNMTFLVVEQNAAAALDLADWVYVMEGGRIVAEGAPSDMAGHDLMRPIETAL